MTASSRIVVIDGVAHDPLGYTPDHPGWLALRDRATQLAGQHPPTQGAPAEVVDLVFGVVGIACESPDLWGPEAQALDRWVSTLTREVFRGRLPVEALAPVR